MNTKTMIGDVFTISPISPKEFDVYSQNPEAK